MDRLTNYEDVQKYRNAHNLIHHRLMGIDWGEKRVGLALTDPTWTLVCPFKTLHRTQNISMIDMLRDLIEAQKVCAAVLGYPLETDGRIGKSAASVLRFKEALIKKCSIPFILWDESFTSEAAREKWGHKQLIQQSHNRLSQNKRGDKKDIDSYAAAFILEEFINNDHHAF